MRFWGWKKKHAPVLATQEQLDNLRSRIDVPDALFDQFQADRVSEEYRSVYTMPEPLVTVCIATYNRPRLLVDRAVRSVLAQTYRNIELIVVGDCCTDETPALMAQVSDPRLTFINLPQRGNYPANPDWRWMVAGTAPVNEALSRARGHFITHLDDDDEYMPNRIEVLVDRIRREQADLVWHPFLAERKPDQWRVNEAEAFRLSRVTTSSTLYHGWFRRLGWDINAYRFREPGDWNRLRKFVYLGAKMAREPTVLLRHYVERSQAGR